MSHGGGSRPWHNRRPPTRINGSDRPMRRTLAALVLALGLIMAYSRSIAGDGVVSSGANVEKLAGGFQFTEGPTCDAEGNLFFTDQPNNRILKWSV